MTKHTAVRTIAGHGSLASTAIGKSAGIFNYHATASTYLTLTSIN